MFTHSFIDFLCKAITEGDFHLVQAVLHNCPTLKVDSPNSRGQRPLVLACMGGQNEILKKLILSRATVDVRLNNGVTPLMIAAELVSPKSYITENLRVSYQQPTAESHRAFLSTEKLPL